MIEHKKQLVRHKEDKENKTHIDKTTEVIFSLRLHALNTAKNLKKFFTFIDFKFVILDCGSAMKYIRDKSSAVVKTEWMDFLSFCLFD